jgi:hypothetical protein
MQTNLLGRKVEWLLNRGVKATGEVVAVYVGNGDGQCRVVVAVDVVATLVDGLATEFRLVEGQ